MKIPNPYLLFPKQPIVFKFENERWEEIPDLIESRLELIVEKFAYMIKALAQYYVPVDQGAAKASIYVVTPYNSDKEQAYAEASVIALSEESRWQHKGRRLEFAEDADDEDSVKKLHALICVGVVYGMWLELGEYTLHATNPGATHPYLTPAIEHYEELFLKACAGVFE